jgi:uncharacterized protein YukE
MATPNGELTAEAIATDTRTREALRAYARHLRTASMGHRWRGDAHAEHRAWLRDEAKACERLADAADALARTTTT